MPNCRDIITRALRKVGAVGVNDPPTTAELEMGMFALQSMFDGWASSGVFGRLRDVHVTEAYTASAGERVRSTQSVTLPTYDAVDTDENDDDYGSCRDATIDRPTNRALIVVVNPTTGVRETNLWDAWVGSWVRIEALAAADDCPLVALGADGLACCLARAIADESTWTVPAQTERQATKFLSRLATGDGRRQPTEAEYF